MKRLVGSLVATFVAAVCATALSVGTAGQAFGIDDVDPDPGWLSNMLNGFLDPFGDEPDAHNAVDTINNVSNLGWDGDAIKTLGPECTTASGHAGVLYGGKCNEINQGLVAPGKGSPVLFSTAAKAAGVKSSSTVAGASIETKGLVVTAGGLGAGTVTVDTATTDLAVAVAGVPGWASGVNVVSGVTATIVSAPAYGATSGSYTIRLHQELCVGTTTLTASQVNALFGASGSITISGLRTGGTTFSGQSTSAAAQFRPSVGACTADATSTFTATTQPVGFDRIQVQMNGVTIVWYPVGNPLRVDLPGGLQGTMKSTFVCRTSSGSTNTHYNSVAVNSTAPVVDVALAGYSCASSELLMSALIEWVTPSRTETIYDYTAPEWVSDTPAEWQTCTAGNCVLKLYKKTGTAKEYCGEMAVGCPEWWSDEEMADNYECRLGPNVVDLNYCAMYRKAGEESITGKVTVDDATGELKVEGPADKPKEWFEQLDEDDVKKPTPTPEPDDPDPIKQGEGDDVVQVGKCFPTGWGLLNPVEWVYRPVTCALTWAFVPREGVVQAQLGRGQAALAGHGVLGVIPEAVEVPGAVAGGFTGGCSGGLFSFDVPTSVGHLQANMPCSPGAVSASFGGPYSTFRTLLGVVLAAGTAWGVFITVRAYFGGKDA